VRKVRKLKKKIRKSKKLKSILLKSRDEIIRSNTQSKKEIIGHVGLQLSQIEDTKKFPKDKLMIKEEDTKNIVKSQEDGGIDHE